MTNSLSLLRRFGKLGLVTLATMLFAVGAHAQNTTSSIRVLVTDDSGGIVGNVPVTITHMPTGRSQTLTANDGGVVTARGLAVGGPYQVALAVQADGKTRMLSEPQRFEVEPLPAGTLKRGAR